MSMIEDTQRFETRNSGFLTRIAGKMARYRVYRTTATELGNLSDRELQDLGISRSEIRAIAYKAAFGG